MTNDEGKDERKVTSDESRLTNDEGTDERRMTKCFLLRNSSFVNRYSSFSFKFFLPLINGWSCYILVIKVKVEMKEGYCNVRVMRAQKGDSNQQHIY